MTTGRACACDLPYVFEKGFTGDSGHEKSKATGMGLYLAREIAKELGLTLTAASDWGAGLRCESRSRSWKNKCLKDGAAVRGAVFFACKMIPAA